MKLYLINMTNAPKPALGIVMDSPQPDVGGARTWNGKPDPFGERPIKILVCYKKKFQTTPKRIAKSR